MVCIHTCCKGLCSDETLPSNMTSPNMSSAGGGGHDGDALHCDGGGPGGCGDHVLDVAGLDSAMPAIISDFIRGELCVCVCVSRYVCVCVNII